MKSKQIETAELIREIVSQNFIPNNGKKTNFLHKILLKSEKFKLTVLKQFFDDENLIKHFSHQITAPYNEILSLLSQKEIWTKDELLKLSQSIEKIIKLHMLEHIIYIVKEYK